MKAKRINTIIERSSDGGYGIYCPDLEGISLFGHGVTEEEAKEDLQNNLLLLLEHYEENNQPIPDVLNSKHVLFDYKYDFSGFFKTYPIFNVSELASMVGVNASLMRRYKRGLAFASPKQREKIEAGIHSLAKQLSRVRF